MLGQNADEARPRPVLASDALHKCWVYRSELSSRHSALKAPKNTALFQMTQKAGGTGQDLTKKERQQALFLGIIKARSARDLTFDSIHVIIQRGEQFVVI